MKVVDAACAIPTLLLGDKLEVAKDMDTETRKLPLGVGAAICPFNFPAMIPLWSLPLAIASGNSLILKPSERVPGAAMIIAELAQKAGSWLSTFYLGLRRREHSTATRCGELDDTSRHASIAFTSLLSPSVLEANLALSELTSKSCRRAKRCALGHARHCPGRSVPLHRAAHQGYLFCRL